MARNDIAEPRKQCSGALGRIAEDRFHHRLAGDVVEHLALDLPDHPSLRALAPVDGLWPANPVVSMDEARAHSPTDRLQDDQEE